MLPSLQFTFFLKITSACSLCFLMCSYASVKDEVVGDAPVTDCSGVSWCPSTGNLFIVAEDGDHRIAVHAFKDRRKCTLKRPMPDIASTKCTRNANAVVVNEEKKSVSELVSVPASEEFEIHNVRGKPIKDCFPVKSSSVRKSVSFGCSQYCQCGHCCFR